MSEGPQDDEQWLSTNEAADLLGVVPRTLYRMVDADGLAAYRIGRFIRLRRDDVLAYIERCRVQPGELRALYPSGDDDVPSEDDAEDASASEGGTSSAPSQR